MFLLQIDLENVIPQLFGVSLTKASEMRYGEMLDRNNVHILDS